MKINRKRVLWILEIKDVPEIIINSVYSVNSTDYFSLYEEKMHNFIANVENRKYFGTKNG